MEKWKRVDVIGPSAEVSTLGKIRRRATHKGKELQVWVSVTPCMDKRGLLIVAFRDGTKQQNKYVHRLVAEAFVKNTERYRFIEFVDGDPANVAGTNLKWVAHPQQYVTTGSGRLLSDTDAQAIRARIACGGKQTDIARDYNVHPSLISHIKAGRKWAL